jgi:hypothetical protein
MEMDDKRRFPRLNLPMFYRFARNVEATRPAQNVSIGGIKVETDDDLAVDTRLELDLFLPDGEPLSVDVRVVWVRELHGQDSRYEAGLEFLPMHEERRTRLERCLTEYGKG